MLIAENKHRLPLEVVGKNLIQSELTNRLELLFMAVLAFPKASSMQLVFMTIDSITSPPPPRAAKYCIAILAVSVLPAPLSPLKITQQEIISSYNNYSMEQEQQKEIFIKTAANLITIDWFASSANLKK